jgi:hypothetical protein
MHEKKGLLLFTAFSAALLVVNGLLLHENYSLKMELERSQRKSPVQKLAIVPPLVGENLEGKAVSLDYIAGNRTLLLVFSPACQACERNWPLWRTLAAGASGVRTVFVTTRPSLDQQFLTRQGLTGQKVLVNINPTSAASYRLYFTPQTILIGPGGRVENAWAGVLEGRALEQVRGALAQSQSSLLDLPIEVRFPWFASGGIADVSASPETRVQSKETRS